MCFCWRICPYGPVAALGRNNSCAHHLEALELGSLVPAFLLTIVALTSSTGLAQPGEFKRTRRHAKGVKKVQESRREPRRAQETQKVPGEPMRPKKGPGEFKSGQEKPGEFMRASRVPGNKAQESPGETRRPKKGPGEPKSSEEHHESP